MESEGRLLHKDWRLYDTAHAVFRPRHMSPEELEEGYAWCYETTLLARLDLAATAGRLARRAALPGDVVSLQAVESALASADPASADGTGLAPAGRVDAAAAPAVPATAGVRGPVSRPRWPESWSPQESEPPARWPEAPAGRERWSGHDGLLAIDVLRLAGVARVPRFRHDGIESLTPIEGQPDGPPRDAPCLAP